MGTIVDLTNLVRKLVESVQDRKFAAELREVQRMISSFQSEQAALHEQNMKLRTENSELKQTIASLERTAPRPDEHARHDDAQLDDISTKILVAVANDDGITKERIIARLALSKAKGDYHFDVLSDRNFACLNGVSDAGSYWGATREGREYLARNNLL